MRISKKPRSLRRGWAVGRAAALMSLTPACGAQALVEDAAHDDEDAYRQVPRDVAARDAHVALEAERGDAEAALEVDLGDRLGVLSQGRLAIGASGSQGKAAGEGKPAGPQLREAHPTASFRWRAPFTGRFRVEFWPEDEPPFRYQLRVVERLGGRVLHDSEAYGSGVVFEAAAGSELQIAVRLTQPAGANEYRLELHEASVERAT